MSAGQEETRSEEVGAETAQDEAPPQETESREARTFPSFYDEDDEEGPLDLGPQEKFSNPMQEPLLSKVVVNIGVGEPGEKVSRASSLLESLTGQKPVRTAARKTNRDLGVRKGDLIGCKVSLRKERANDFLKMALEAVDGVVRSKWFDEEGNFSFGIEEHINIPGIQYDPQIGIYGMDVCVTIDRKGYRIKRRKLKKMKIPKHHRVSKIEAMRFIRDNYGVRVV